MNRRGFLARLGLTLPLLPALPSILGRGPDLVKLLGGLGPQLLSGPTTMHSVHRALFLLNGGGWVGGRLVELWRGGAVVQIRAVVESWRRVAPSLPGLPSEAIVVVRYTNPRGIGWLGWVEGRGQRLLGYIDQRGRYVPAMPSGDRPLVP